MASVGSLSALSRHYYEVLAQVHESRLFADRELELGEPLLGQLASSDPLKRLSLAADGVGRGHGNDIAAGVL